MAENAGRMIALLGVVGIGGFAIYQYMEYEAALNTINSKDPSGQTSQQIQALMPFMSYLMALISPPAAGTPQASALLWIKAAQTGQLSQMGNPSTPGTSASTGQPSTTTVSTVPTTTPVTSGSTSPGTTTVAISSSASPQPTATDLQNALQTTLGSADQWNFVYRELTGYGIEQRYGGNFDAIYGPVGSNGQRPTGTITAQAFLNLPVAEGLHGLGAIARFYTPVVNPMGSMVYRAQHPSPYRLPVSGGMMGLGAMTQATGFEKALWSGGFIRSRRIR